MEIENKKRKTRNHEVVALPQELIEKILLLLPLKSLVRFRCVSKQWFSMISDSHFTKSHFDLAPTTTNDMLIYFSPVNSVARCVDVEESIHRDYAVRIPVTYEHYALRVRGSCRGFILLLNCVNGTHFVMWNPTTGFHTRVSYPSGLSYPLWAGVGYDKSSDDYLVVAGWRDRFEKTSNLRHRWEFFSVRNHSWKEIETGDFHSNHLISCNSGVFCNGAIHWLAVRTVGDSARVVVAFGLEEKNLSIISLPDLQGGGTPTLNLLGGYLGICYTEWQTWRNELWVLKEYKVESSWTKLNIDFPDGFIPMCLTRGSECVGRKNIKELMKFSDKGMLLESRRTSCDIHTIMLMFARTLLTLPGQ
ncbi:hypothetical protein HN51_020911 [Arachis hypogaea]|uniref:F-box domain-containing protein n=1 Tax=Arachis hypogaea TaxID=3818 RepID=A0A445EIP0_ARAHY|nr:F-box protein CPR1 [Arachis hypogaea]QHO51773.1 F-box protein [Arachis hypogaea]RYR75327.1 hypothetical protein Ahy_A02g009981 [Arachis hypogaea]